MKTSKGKEFIPPDKGYTIEEMHHCGSRFKSFFVRVFNKKSVKLLKTDRKGSKRGELNK